MCAPDCLCVCACLPLCVRSPNVDGLWDGRASLIERQLLCRRSGAGQTAPVSPKGAPVSPRGSNSWHKPTSLRVRGTVLGYRLARALNNITQLYKAKSGSLGLALHSHLPGGRRLVRGGPITALRNNSKTPMISGTYTTLRKTTKSNLSAGSGTYMAAESSFL